MEIKPSAQDDFSRTITKENERQAAILKNLQAKAISQELSQKNYDARILVDFIIPFSILSI